MLKDQCPLLLGFILGHLLFLWTGSPWMTLGIICALAVILGAWLWWTKPEVETLEDIMRRTSGDSAPADNSSTAR